MTTNDLRRKFFVCLMVLFCSVEAGAQSTKDDVVARLKGKPLYLRGCWRDKDLRFNADGALIGQSKPVSITLCGFDFDSAQIKPDKLVIKGRRVGLEFPNGSMKRVKLDDENMRIEIQAASGNDYAKALDSIFVDGLEGMVPTLPSYWQTFWQKHFIAGSAPVSPNQKSAGLKRIGGAISAPQPIHTEEPEFTDIARRMKYSGTVLLYLWVNTDGTVSHLSIDRPTGLGLDEAALAAVADYRFKPAMENGKPVLVELKIEVAFSLLQK